MTRMGRCGTAAWSQDGQASWARRALWLTRSRLADRAGRRWTLLRLAPIASTACIVNFSYLINTRQHS